MAISISQGFKVTGKGLPIDDRFILSKAEMAKTLLPYSKENPLPFYMPDHYLAVCSDDGKLYIYDKINNPPSEETGYFKVVAAEGSGNTIWQGDREAGETDSEAIARITAGATPSNGDIVIIRTLIEEGKYSHKSFIHDGTNWKAMDGNYDAENVYFSDNIVTAGTYDRVGNITKGETIEAAGKSVKEVFEKIFTKELNPTTTQPSVTISSFNSGSYEVGTSIVPTYTIALNPGAYTYDTSTGVTATSYSAVDTEGNTKVTASGTFDALTVGDNTNYYVNFSISHGAGIIPHTNLGNEYAAGQIIAGTKTNQSSGITGFRKYFYGSTTTIPEVVDSDFIRNLTNSSAKLNSSTTTFSMPVVEGANRVYIAFVSSANKSLKNVLDTGAFGTDIKDSFVKTTVNVKGANDYAAVSYDVYTYAPDAALGANTYKVTIG